MYTHKNRCYFNLCSLLLRTHSHWAKAKAKAKKDPRRSEKYQRKLSFALPLLKFIDVFSWWLSYVIFLTVHFCNGHFCLTLLGTSRLTHCVFQEPTPQDLWRQGTWRGLSRLVSDTILHIVLSHFFSLVNIRLCQILPKTAWNLKNLDGGGPPKFYYVDHHWKLFLRNNLPSVFIYYLNSN